MKYYGYMLEKKPNGTIDTALGSDAICILDARNTLTNMQQCCRVHIRRLKQIHPYVGFKIYKGNLKPAKHIYTELTNPTSSMSKVVK